MNKIQSLFLYLYGMKERFNVNHIPELKQAIIDLPDKEKNQLLIRLINKDQILIEHCLAGEVLAASSGCTVRWLTERGPRN